ncbi:MAG: MFS transporter, partial [Mycobacteriales bacterium]
GAGDPLLPGGLVRDRRFTGAALGAFAAALAVFVLLVFVSLYLQLVQDLDPQAAGAVLLPLPVALVVTAALAGRWHAVAPPVVLGLLLAGGGLVALGTVLEQGTDQHLLEVWLAVVGAGVGLTTAPVVTASLSSAGEARAGLAAASVNVARELGGVVAVAGLGALAVARLSSRLTTTLAGAGVPAGQRPALLDALLGARTSEVRTLLLQDLGIEKALPLNGSLAGIAKGSFVGSTQLVLQAAGGALLAVAVLSGWLLRRRVA